MKIQNSDHCGGGECLPCSVCPERTLTMCSYIRDTECVTQREWVRRGLGLPGAVMTSGDSVMSPEDDSEGVVVFRSLSDSDSDKVERDSLWGNVSTLYFS